MDTPVECERCAAAKVAGYATCPEHRDELKESFEGVAAHHWMQSDAAVKDTVGSAERNAMRTWTPQVVHYHQHGESCNDRCRQIFPQDLPEWGGANPE